MSIIHKKKPKPGRKKMKSIFISLVVMAISLNPLFALADDYTFGQCFYTWHLTDYPRWHYDGDMIYGTGGVEAPMQFVDYIQIELKLSENTLIDPNVIHMHFEVDIDYNYWEFYFDIIPGEMETVQQFPINYMPEFGPGELYRMRELNTIPEGGGYMVINQEESMLDRFTHYEVVEPESLGEVKALFN
jgi:hypothetical protein